MSSRRPWRDVLPRYQRRLGSIWFLWGWYPFRLRGSGDWISFRCLIEAIATLHEIWDLDEDALLAAEFIVRRPEVSWKEHPIIEPWMIRLLIEYGVFTEDDGRLIPTCCFGEVIRDCVGGLEQTFVCDPEWVFR